MATWEDGPEYAPVERPTGFESPDVAPLTQAEARHQPSSEAPREQPQFREADSPGPALATIGPEATDDRDPSRPFAVAQSALTSETSAWAGAHGSRYDAPPGQDPATGWGSPDQPSMQAPGTGYPVPGRHDRDATKPFLLSGGNHELMAQSELAAGSYPPPGEYPPGGFPPPTGQPAQQGGFPAPGTVDWFRQSPGSPPQGNIAGSTQGFAPPPPGAAPVAQRRLGVWEGLTPGYLIALGACLIYPLAPICLTIALILSRRVLLYRLTITKVALGGWILWVLIAVTSLLLGPSGFGDWWWTISLWGMLIGLSLLVVSIVVVKVKQNNEDQRPPYDSPYQSFWG